MVSARDAGVRNNPDGLAAYLDLLAQHAFGNARELLEAVTLSPAMGIYLDMAASSKAIPERGVNPNENYAREILQLFSIGLYELHPDGTLRLDADNQPIPTYDQEVVKAFARAFTGWTLGGQSQRDPRRFFRPQRNYPRPHGALGGVPRHRREAAARRDVAAGGAERAATTSSRRSTPSSTIRTSARSSAARSSNGW